MGEHASEKERHDAFVRASNRRVWRITAVAVAAILGLGFGGAAVIKQISDSNAEQKRDSALQRAQAELLERQRADIACVKRWADDYTRRADRIGELNQPKSDALDRLVENIGDRAAFDHWRKKYLEASRRARVNAQDNPLPASPVFACGLDPSAGPRPHTPRPTRAAGPTSSPAKPSTSPRTTSSPTARNTATGHALPAPASRTTRTVPAPPRTRTVTAPAPSPAPSTSSRPPVLPLPPIVSDLVCRPPRLVPAICGG